MVTHQYGPLRTATGLVLVALASGCGGTETAPSTPPARRASSERPQSEQPAGTIVIRGRGGQTPPRDAEEDRDWERIAELEERARASQGQPATPAAPRDAAKPAPQTADEREQERKQLEAELASLTKQISDLQAEKESLLEDKRVRRGGRRVLREVSSDPERTKAIEAQLAELDGRKQAVQQKLAALPR
ncbi:MAG: hypothetical protein AB7T63_17075 [Planctomycetota bacterium]